MIRISLLAIAFMFFLEPVSAQNTLDQIGLGPSTPSVGAYSVRKLSSTYLGPAIRIRRSSDNTEQNIAFLPSGELDTVSLKNFTGSGSAFVSTWYDQSGYNNHVVQSTLANQPQIVLNGQVIRQNGLPAIAFNDSPGSFLTLTTATNIAGLANTSMFMAGRMTGGNNTQDILFALGTGGSSTRARLLYRQANSSTMGYATWANDIPSSSVTWDLEGSTHVFSAIQSGQSVTLSRDQQTTTQSLPGAPGTVAGNSISIGTVAFSPATYTVDMVASEFLAFGTALSATEQQTVQCSQTSYYSISNTGSASASIGSTNVPAACLYAEETVIWNNGDLLNTSALGSTLKKVIGSSAWNGGGASLNRVYDNGYFEFTASEINTARMIGLSSSNTDANFTGIQYAIYLRSDGIWEIYESGTGRGSFGNYQSGDKFRIAVENGRIRYYRNNVLVFNSTTLPTLPLIVDASINTTGGTLTEPVVANLTGGDFDLTVAGATPSGYEWRFNGNPQGSGSSYSNPSIQQGDIIEATVTYPGICGATSVQTNRITIIPAAQPDIFNITALAAPSSIACNLAETDVVWDRSTLNNLRIQGSDLFKIQTSNWDGGAASVNTIHEEGYISFSTDEINRAKMIGLSNSPGNSSFTSIQYAIYLRNDGIWEIYESGASRANLGNYQVGDQFRIAVESGSVRYYRNGTLVYFSPTVPSLPLLVDVSLHTIGSSVKGLKVVNYSNGNFSASIGSSFPNPSVQWYLNGAPAGNNLTYSNGNLQHNDELYFTMQPGLAGCTGITYSSNRIINKYNNTSAGINFTVSTVASPASCSIAEETVSWNLQSFRNARATGNNLVRVQSPGSWSAGASSVNRVFNEGAFTFTAQETNTALMAGLSSTDPDANFTTIQYAIYLRNDGILEIYESGIGRGSFGTYQVGDQFRIAVEEGVVKYYRNGSPLYISTITPVLPLIADVSINTIGGSVGDARISNYTGGSFQATVDAGVTNPIFQWFLNGNPVGSNSSTYNNGTLSNGDVVTCVLQPNLAGCSSASYTSNSITIRQVTPAGISFAITATAASSGCSVAEEQVSWDRGSLNNVVTNGNDLRKIQSNGQWNGNASSLNRVYDEGYLVFTATETNTARMIGLSSTDVNANFSSIQYAVYLRSDGIYEIYESGNARINLGTYAAGDEFRIGVEGGRVRYYRNGNLVFNSPITPTLPLLADVSIATTGGTVTNARIFNYSQGVFNAAVSSNITNPVFQWFLNGNPVGTNSATYTNTGLNNGDVVTCILTPNLDGCSASTIASNTITNRRTTPAGIDFSIVADAAASGCIVAEETVSWDRNSLNNLSVSGSDLRKIQNNGVWDGGAFSINKVHAEGYMQFRAADVNRELMIGLSNTNTDNNFSSIQFAIFLRNNGSFEIYESGIGIGNFGTYAVDDIFRISVENGRVRYFRGSTEIYQSLSTPTLPLSVDVSINNTDGRVTDARVVNYSQGTYRALASSSLTNPVYQWFLNGNPVGTNAPTYTNNALSNNDVITCVLTPNLGGCDLTSYTSNSITNRQQAASTSLDFYITAGSTSSACTEAVEEVVWRKSDLLNVTSSGNSLVKIQSNGQWNGGAASINTVNNNGYLQFTASETTTHRMIGLSSVNTNANFNTIQYAVYLRSDASFEIYESGAGMGNFGTYQTGDVFRISVENGTVRYARNGSIVFISSIAPTLPLVADVSINSVGGTVTNALVVNNTSAGLFTAITQNAGTNPLITWRVNGSVVQSGTSTSYINTSLPAGSVVTAELNPALNGCSSAVYPSNSITLNGPGASTNWTGAVSSNWFNPSNWSNGVPDRFRSANIPSGVPNFPILTSSVNVYDLTINNGATLTVNSTNQIFIFRSFTNNGNFVAGLGRVTFTSCGNGGTAISGSGTTNFHNLTINNPNGVTFSSGNITVSNNMNFVNGIVMQNANLTILNGATATGASNQSFVNGVVRKTGNQAFTFPVGKNGFYRPISITNPSSVTDQFSAEYFNVPQTAGSALQAPIVQISGCEYWQLDRNAGSSNVGVRLSWDRAACSIYSIPSISTLLVSQWNGSLWTNRGASAATGNSDNGSVSSAGTVNAFGLFTLATSSVFTVLPVSLTSFDAQKMNGAIQLNWTTSSENNNSHFVVERSDDGINFYPIGSVKGNGTTSIPHQYAFTDSRTTGYTRIFYRLKKVDFNGNAEYSKVVRVTLDQQWIEASVYPNPGRGQFNLKADFRKIRSINILNMAGAVLRKLPLQQQHDVSDLTPGIYLIRLQGDDGEQVLRFVKQ